MAKMKKIGSISLVTVYLMGLFLSTGCTKYASQEELNALDAQREAALSAERSVSDCESDLASLERQVSGKRSELNDVRAEKAKVRDRLAQMQ